jgi:hypothetical protein
MHRDNLICCQKISTNAKDYVIPVDDDVFGQHLLLHGGFKAKYLFILDNEKCLSCSVTCSSVQSSRLFSHIVSGCE